MPILPKEPSCFPPDLFDLPPVEEEPDRLWWAVYTKARQEKSLARQLAEMRVPHYLPLMRKVSRSRKSGRRTESYSPLFAGYAFLYASENERVKALTTNRIVTVLPVQDQPRLRTDLIQVKRLIDSNTPLELETELLPGQSVRVIDGALRGIEGIVTHCRNDRRLLIAVHMMRQGVSVSIQDFRLEPIE